MLYVQCGQIHFEKIDVALGVTLYTQQIYVGIAVKQQ
jgi:hypothetical protein